MSATKLTTGRLESHPLDYHEQGGQRLGVLTTVIARARGSPIDTSGSTDLLVRDDRLRIIQADQTVYLHRHETPPASCDRGGRRRAA